MGCFGVGCITVLIAGFFFFLVVIGCAWYVCWEAADKLTSPQRVDLKVVRPDQAQIDAAEGSLTRLRNAVSKNEETIVGFTAADLNAIIDQKEDFEDIRDRVRFEIANSIMTVKVSAPLGEIRWKKVQERWLNAVASVTFDYSPSGFDIDIQRLEMNGHEISDSFLSMISSWVSEGFTSHFQDEVRKENLDEFWAHVKSMSVEDDKVVVTTKKD